MPPLPPEIWDRVPLEAQALILAMQAEIAVLRAEVADLKARLDQNSSNSHKPPGSDPPLGHQTAQGSVWAPCSAPRWRSGTSDNPMHVNEVQPADPQTEPGSFAEVLRNRQFVSLWTGQILSQLADKVFYVLQELRALTCAH
jgi:hypothetical protein